MTLGQGWLIAGVTLVLCNLSVAQEGLSVGAEAPEFQLPTINGTTTSLHEFLNKKLVIVHFWKSKWRECQAEFPPLKRIFQEYKEVPILSINPIDMEGRVKADAESFDLPYDVLIGRDSDIISDYEIMKLPRILIVRKNGTIAATERFLPHDKLKEALEGAIKEK